MKALRLFLFVLIFNLFLAFPAHLYAIYNPTDVPVNKYGIHILDISDIDDAAKLVNGQGNWGNVTFVIQDDDLNIDKWKPFFLALREKRLIPIVRIATHVENGNWAKPTEETLRKFADFLEFMPWPIENRYVIIFNEPNMAGEWGGDLSPAEYARILSKAVSVFKSTDPNFFILNAGFNSTAQNISGKTMDVTLYWQWMNEAVPGIFTMIDGWVSHPYPDGNFLASPYKSGRYSIQAYKWEEEYLKNSFNTGSRPVFITETGWNADQLSSDTVSDYYKIAFTEIWTDTNIVAITPFVLSYQDNLFSRFSWKILGQNSFLPKVMAKPILGPVSPFGVLLAKELALENIF
ncbi:MAG: hypothetical protein UT63_C0019G0028 [Candidatus Gottesmanbacteria bacterium GW2011_GWC2_39_8]|uniref:Asl1-like glycosyl hydrolase catalytic domain-containing protein n=1 Tax=Candidatus Gottesmanbacteria bacterium GW2011_GWC2_39_8 TaxID=1618450 RepID=A0A0G0Q7K0_9BACT|nr:MAG: hypothetical protein UT63_C0019G0028 [Candidatus Gottesmanbacteria bacterium GW2011_GWC2_39_8]